MVTINNTLKDAVTDVSLDSDVVSKRQTSTIACPLCKGESVITDPASAEIICCKCGMVILDKIEEQRSGSKPGAPSILKDKNQTGTAAAPTPLARSDMGLSTIIGKADNDASGKKIDPSMQPTLQRLRTWDFRIQTYKTGKRNLIDAFSQLDKLKHKLALSDSIIENTAYIYRKAHQRGLVRGRSVSVVLSAAVYLACREAGIPKTLKEISEANNIKYRMVAKAYRVLISELDIKIPSFDPMKCVVKVVNKASLNEKIKRQAIDIMNKVKKNEISAGKDPMGLAATVLYISCLNTGENRTKKEIANAAGITDLTLRNRFNELKSKLQLRA